MSALTAILPLLFGAAAAGGSLLALNAAIRYGLRAPRVPNASDPARYGLPFQAVRLPARRGRMLSGWLLPAAGENCGAAPALVVLHGWGGNSATMLPLAAPFRNAGYALLFIDARCHGASDDDDFASLPRFAEDLESAFDWLHGQATIDPRRIALLGHSVGAAAALLLAARRDDVAAVVSIAAFAHPESVMRRYLAARRIPFVPLGWYVLHYVQKTIGRRFAQIAPQHTIAAVGCPVLLVHGRDDQTVPVGDARLIHAGRRDERKKLLLVAGSHDDYRDLEKRVGEVIAFVTGALGEGRR